MRVKDFLLSRYISGIGNIYASEISSELYSPREKNERFDTRGKEKLFITIPQVLKEAIAHQGTTIRNYVRLWESKESSRIHC